MATTLSHFIRPLTILALLVVPAATAGVSLQLDVTTETKAMDALVRFVTHPDSASAITPSGTYADVEINVRANGKQMVAVETTPPPGQMNARLELVSATGFGATDDLVISLKADQTTPVVMANIQGGVVTQTTAASVLLPQGVNSQIIYQPSKGMSLTADAHIQLVLTPVGLDSIEVRYDLHLLGTLTGPILVM